MTRSFLLALCQATILAVAGTQALSAPGKPPPICGAMKRSGPRFSITCSAQDNSHLSVVLTGASGGDTGGTEFDRIVVYRNGAKLQEIAAKGDFWEGDDRLVEFADINFDGFDDLKVMTSTSAGPNAGFDYWLFNPRSGKFDHSDIGDKLSGFDVLPDPHTKTIRVTGRSSCCDWESATYKWIGAALHITLLSDEGAFDVSDTPPLDGDNLQFCGTETKRFDDAGGLVRVDFARATGKDACDHDGEALPDLLKLFREKQKGYAITVLDVNRFTIRYATPLPGHDSL